MVMQDWRSRGYGANDFAVFRPRDARLLTATGTDAVLPAAMPDRLRWVGASLRDFYRDREAWLVLLTTAFVLCYGCGLLMFWYHFVELGEGGPAISWYSHWLLDSSFAFVALTPALSVIIPLAALASDRLARPGQARVPWLYVGVTGGLFAIVTTPGPVGHDMFVGRGTWVAHQATKLIGDPSAQLTPVTDYPIPVSMAQQFVAGVPTYLAGAAVALLLVRAVLARRRAARPDPLPDGG